MNPNPAVGNRVILLAVALTLAVISLFVVWGTVTLSAGDIQSSMKINGQQIGFKSNGPGGDMNQMMSGMMSSMAGLTIPVTGKTGRFLGLPYWVWIIPVVFALIIQALNLTGFSAVPRPVIVVLLMIGMMAAVFSIGVLLFNGTVGIGGFLLLAATVIGISQVRACDVNNFRSGK